MTTDVIDSSSPRPIHVGLRWGNVDTEDVPDLDISCFMLTDEGLVRGNDDFIFYNQLESPCGSVEHLGDHQTGEADEDAEVILVRLDKVPSAICKLVFTVTIHEHIARKHHFGLTESACVRIVSCKGNEMDRLNFVESVPTNSGVIFGELYRQENLWKFRRISRGTDRGLGEIAEHYGVEVE